MRTFPGPQRRLSAPEAWTQRPSGAIWQSAARDPPAGRGTGIETGPCWWAGKEMTTATAPVSPPAALVVTHTRSPDPSVLVSLDSEATTATFPSGEPLTAAPSSRRPGGTNPVASSHRTGVTWRSTLDADASFGRNRIAGAIARTELPGGIETVVERRARSRPRRSRTMNVREIDRS